MTTNTSDQETGLASLEEPEDELPIDETDSAEDEAPETLHFDIASYPADYTVKVLVEKWRDGQLVIPDFQRAYVWNQPQASKLIESFLLGLPVPQVFLYKDRDSQKLLVVDGHQRLSTIAQYYSGQFRDKRIFRLQGVHARWLGKRYTDLDEADRLRLDDSTLRSIVIQQLTPDDNESIYLIFERLNAGGVKLNPMEIRKTVFHGPAIQMLERVNRDRAWRGLLGLPRPEPRLRDLELVARALALATDWQGYTKPMKTFITNYLGSLAKMTDTDRQHLEDRFLVASKAVHAGLGDRPFHLRGRLNVAALDMTLGTVMAASITDSKHIRRCFRRLTSNKQFQQDLFFNTSDAAVVKNRFKGFTDCLESK